MTETGAIAEFVAARVLDKGLVPADPWQAGQTRSICYYLASTFHVNRAHGARGMRRADQPALLEDMHAKMTFNMASSCAFTKPECALDRFVTGADFTIADPLLFAISTWLQGDGIDVDQCPRLKAHRAAMAARPSAKAIRIYGLLK